MQVDFQRMEMVSSSTNVWKKVYFSSEFSLVKCLCACVIPWIPNLKTDWWRIILSWSKYHYDRSPFCVFCLHTFFSVKTLKVISWILFMLEIYIVSIPFFITRWTGTGYIIVTVCVFVCHVFSCVICFRFIHFILISIAHALFLTCLPVSIYGT